MGTLYEDLAAHTREAYTGQDVVAGLKLLAELVGLASVLAVAGALTTVTIPFVGPRVSGPVMRKLAQVLFDGYRGLSAEDRRLVRAALSIVPNPVNTLSAFTDRLDELKFFWSAAEEAGEWADRLGDMASAVQDRFRRDG
jgi:hypothetical protein